MTRAAAISMALVFLAIGFLVGRLSAPSAESPEVAKQEVSRETSDHDPATATKDPSPGSRPDRTKRGNAGSTTRPGATGETDASATTRPNDSPSGEPGQAELEEPTVEQAEELLAILAEALEGGDAGAIQELTTPLTRHAEFVVPELTLLLAEADSLFAKENLARLLGATGDPRALNALQDLLAAEENAEVRTAAITSLGQIPDPSSVGLLQGEFTRKSDSPMPPSMAATSLGKIATPEAVTALQKEVKEGDNRMVRAFAVNALSELEDPELIPFFLEQVRRTEGTSERYRKSAIQAIARTRDASAIPQLETLVFAENESQGIREAAKRAINDIAGETLYEVR